MQGLFENNHASLISALKSGDRKVFAQIYQEQSKSLFLKLLQLVGSEKIAQDLLQELFIKLWVKKSSLDIHTNLAAYLNKMAANLAYDFFRQTAREQKLRATLLDHFEFSYDPSTAEPQSQHLEDALNHLIEDLPPQRKKVIQLCKLQGKSYQEAGHILGISAATVNDHIVKATKVLRARLLEKNTLSAAILLLFYWA